MRQLRLREENKMLEEGKEEKAEDIKMQVLRSFYNSWLIYTPGRVGARE